MAPEASGVQGSTEPSQRLSSANSIPEEDEEVVERESKWSAWKGILMLLIALQMFAKSNTDNLHLHNFDVILKWHLGI